MTERDAWMVIGEIVGPFGVRGEMKVEPLTDFPERFRRLRAVFVGPDHTEMEVERARRHGARFVLKLRNVDTPEAVDRLRLLELAVPREQAVPLPKGHFYLDDLIGLSATDTRDRALGTVTDVIRTGANDVLVVGTGKDALLVPLIADAIRTLDVDAGTVVVEDWILAPAE